MAVILNEQNFASEISSWVTLVDFWAEWCGPCQMMLPILEELSAKWNEKQNSKVNVDENPSLVRIRVMSIPTFIFSGLGTVEQWLELAVWDLRSFLISYEYC